jgi:preprotein translocase subunit SecE
VARDRKRAKQRRDRRATRATRRSAAASDATRESAQATPPLTPADGSSAAADVPGALEHASADVDEFEAALARGAERAGAEPKASLGDGIAAPERPAETDEPASALEPATGEEAGPAGDELELPGRGGDGGGDGDDGGRGGEGAPEGPERDRASGAPLRGGSRAVAFLQASWAELQRVQWPDRRQVTQATAVVLGFVAVAGAYLGVADYVAKEIVELVLG